MNSDYSPIADEYYDSNLHPTCHDFGYASAALVAAHVRIQPPTGVVCEVGAGLSTLLSVTQWPNTSARAVVTDLSAEMLEHSKRRYSGQAEFLVCDARKLPFFPGSMDMLIASLGDPYNSAEFWIEAHRVLKTSGGIFYTTPSWDWAKAFRPATKDERDSSALFINRSNEKIYLRSEILPEKEQIAAIEHSGLTVRSTHSFFLSNLVESGIDISPKIGKHLDNSTPIVTGYWAKKPNM